MDQESEISKSKGSPEDIRYPLNEAFKDGLREIFDTLEDINKRLTNLDTRCTNFDERINGIDSRLVKIDTVDKKVDKKVTDIDQKVTKVDRRVDGVNAEVTAVKPRVGAIEARIRPKVVQKSWYGPLSRVTEELKDYIENLKPRDDIKHNEFLVSETIESMENLYDPLMNLAEDKTVPKTVSDKGKNLHERVQELVNGLKATKQYNKTTMGDAASLKKYIKTILEPIIGELRALLSQLESE